MTREQRNSREVRREIAEHVVVGTPQRIAPMPHREDPARAVPKMRREHRAEAMRRRSGR